MQPASVPERPSLALLGSEPLRAALEYIAHRTMRTPNPSEGDGHPVIIFPGLASDGRAVVPLRDHCRRLGYEAHDWGRGLNTGPTRDVERWLRRLADEVSDTLEGFGEPATLVGWSLGGLYAREVAKQVPRRVRQVITIGTPFNADADHTNVGWLYRVLNGDGPKIDPALAKRLRTPPPVPTTSIYSKRDGVVAWQTCLHGPDAHAQVQDIEVGGSHIGMGWNPEVLAVVGDRLRQRPPSWAPYRAPAARSRWGRSRSA